MHSEGKIYAEIGQPLSCSNKMIRNALVYTKKKIESRGRKSAMSKLLVKKIGTRKQKTSSYSAKKGASDRSICWNSS